MTRYLKTLILLVAALMVAASPVYGQRKPSKEERERWYKEMQQYKRDFMVKELQLTDEQKAKFLPIYEQMTAEVDQVNHDTRRMVRQVEKKGDAATDLEREKAAEASFELPSKVGAIEMKYYKELKGVLSPAQLLKFKQAENKFTNELMKHRRPKDKKDS